MNISFFFSLLIFFVTAKVYIINSAYGVSYSSLHGVRLPPEDRDVYVQRQPDQHLRDHGDEQILVDSGSRVT